MRLRETSLKLLPVLVVAWATLIMLGGALYLARHAGPPDTGQAVKAGLGLCAISVAVLAGKVVRRVAPPAHTYGLLASSSARPPDGEVSCFLSGPPATGPPIFRLLRVSRT